MFLFQDDKSSLDLARESGSHEIMEVMELNPTMTSGKDPFMNILSNYMAEKGRDRKMVSLASRHQFTPFPVHRGVMG